MSAMKFCLVFLFAFFGHVLTQGFPQPCPFNPKECNCTLESPSDPSTFFTVNCKSATFPTFTASPNGTLYSVSYRMRIIGQVDQIPSNQFKIFKTISMLNLVYETSASRPPIVQKWDPLAFSNVSGIEAFEVSGLTGVIPLPPALSNMNNSKLEQFVHNDGGSVQLKADCFKALPKLTDVRISNTKITEIDPNAFSSLAPTLRRLTLSGASLTDYPAAALSNLVKLKSFDLSDNKITTISDKAFLAPPSLETLTLDGNNLAETIAKGTFDNLPKNIVELSLDNVGLTDVPQRIIKNGQFTYLSLRGNSIQTIRTDDFKNGDKLTWLALSNNPISNIEKDAFSNLTEVYGIDLSNTNLASIDLSIFPKASEPFVILDDNQLLKSLVVTDINKVSKQADFYLTNTSLESVDKKIDDLLKQAPGIEIELFDDIHLKCEGLEWMAPYVLGTKVQIQSKGAICADKDQPLKDYLKQFLPTGLPPVDM